MLQPPYNQPYAAPNPVPPMQMPPIDHRARMTGPGVGLIVAGSLSAISSLVFAIWAIFIAIAAQGVSEVTARMDEIDHKNEMTEQEREMFNEVSSSISMFGQGVSAGLVVLGALVFVASGLMIFGGVQLTRGRSYGLCIIAAVLAMLPSGCWLVSLPMGIWAIIVLLDNKVKAEFT